MSNNIKLSVETVRELDHALIGALYTGIGTAFDEPVRSILISNRTDGFLMFSFDGVNDHFPLLQSSFLSLDLTKNKSDQEAFFISAGQKMYVKQINAPSNGVVYITAFADKPS